jgi:hypothetical protein
MVYNIRKAWNGKNAARKRARTIRSIGRAIVPRGSFARAGSALGSRYGAVGSDIGGYAGSRISKYVGFGHYYPKHGNKYMRGGHKRRSGRITRRGGVDFQKHSSITFSNTEYIGLLLSSSNNGSGPVGAPSKFNSQCYGNQPGLPQFPFLSVLASNFCKYRWKKLVWEFRTITSESIGSVNGTAATLGQILAGIDYDVSTVSAGSEAAGTQVYYANAAALMNSEGAISVKPSDNFDMGVELARKSSPFEVQYIRFGSTPTGTDIRLYDGSGVQFSTQNIPITSGIAIAVGEIYCHYEIELISPQLGGNLNALQSAHYSLATGGSTITTANPLGTTGIPLATAANQLPLIFCTQAAPGIPAGANVQGFSFPVYITQGRFMVTLTYLNTAAVAGWTGFTPFVINGTIVSRYQGGANSVNSAPNLVGQVCQYFVTTFIVDVDAPGAALCSVMIQWTTPTGITIPANTGQLDLVVSPYNSAMQ